MAMRAESLDILEKADLTPPQARAIVRVIETEIAGASNPLATKHDLKHEIMVLRSEFKEDIAKLEVRLEGQIHASASGIARQMYTAILGQMAVLLGFAYFFATHLR